MYLAPPIPASNVFPTSIGKSSTSAKVMFRKNFFSHSHGPVTSYTIIVAEDDAIDSKQPKMPSWNDVQKYSKWPPYQVLLFNNTILKYWFCFDFAWVVTRNTRAKNK